MKAKNSLLHDPLLPDTLAAADNERIVRQYDCFSVESRDKVLPATLCVTDRRVIFAAKSKPGMPPSLVHETDIDAVSGYCYSDRRTSTAKNPAGGIFIALLLCALLAVTLYFACQIPAVRQGFPSDFPLETAAFLLCVLIFLGYIAYAVLKQKSSYTVELEFCVFTHTPGGTGLMLSTSPESRPPAAMQVTYRQTPSSSRLIKEFGALIKDLQTHDPKLVDRWCADFSVFDGAVQEILTEADEEQQ